VILSEFSSRFLSLSGRKIKKRERRKEPEFMRKPPILSEPEKRRNPIRTSEERVRMNEKTMKNYRRKRRPFDV